MSGPIASHAPMVPHPCCLPGAQASLPCRAATCHGPLHKADHIVQHAQHCGRLAAILAQVQAQPLSSLHLHTRSSRGPRCRQATSTVNVQQAETIYDASTPTNGVSVCVAAAAHCSSGRTLRTADSSMSWAVTSSSWSRRCCCSTRRMRSWGRGEAHAQRTVSIYSISLASATCISKKRQRQSLQAREDGQVG